MSKLLIPFDFYNSSQRDIAAYLTIITSIWLKLSSFFGVGVFIVSLLLNKFILDVSLLPVLGKHYHYNRK